MKLKERLEQILGKDIDRLVSMGGGTFAEVHRIILTDGTSFVAKTSSKRDGTPALEGRMLSYLASNSNLPVPDVMHAEPDLLIINWVETRGGLTQSAEVDAARHLAALHDVPVDHFGFDFDTLIGGLHQPNPISDNWIDFFREHRLLYMAQVAHKARRLPAELIQRLERFVTHLEDWLYEPVRPSLIHGDMWGGNVLTYDGQIAGFIDPAIYHAHAEIELAFSTLFGTFGSTFFDEYQNLRRIEPGFFETRRDIYNLYPLLVHIRLFGGGYVSQFASTLRRFGH